MYLHSYYITYWLPKWSLKHEPHLNHPSTTCASFESSFELRTWRGKREKDKEKEKEKEKEKNVGTTSQCCPP